MGRGQAAWDGVIELRESAAAGPAWTWTSGSRLASSVGTDLLTVGWDCHQGLHLLGFTDS